jgi:hypothetical protein
LITTFDVHHVLSLKTTLTMPSRRVSQCLHPEEGLPQTSNQNQLPFQQPSTQTLPTITEATENPTFDNIPEIQLQQVNISTTAVGTSPSSGGDHHLNTNLPPPPPPSQVNSGEAELNQIKIQNWDEAEEDEAEAEENELIRIQQEIERLRQEQESIMRRQAAVQRAEARRQHINRERANLVELQYTVDILRQQERQDLLPDQKQ